MPRRPANMLSAGRRELIMQHAVGPGAIAIIGIRYEENDIAEEITTVRSAPQVELRRLAVTLTASVATIVLTSSSQPAIPCP